jgi:hypothetical protein
MKLDPKESLVRLTKVDGPLGDWVIPLKSVLARSRIFS